MGICHGKPSQKGNIVIRTTQLTPTPSTSGEKYSNLSKACLSISSSTVQSSSTNQYSPGATDSSTASNSIHTSNSAPTSSIDSSPKKIQQDNEQESKKPGTPQSDLSKYKPTRSEMTASSSKIVPVIEAAPHKDSLPLYVTATSEDKLTAKSVPSSATNIIQTTPKRQAKPLLYYANRFQASSTTSNVSIQYSDTATRKSSEFSSITQGCLEETSYLSFELTCTKSHDHWNITANNFNGQIGDIFDKDHNNEVNIKYEEILAEEYKKKHVEFITQILNRHTLTKNGVINTEKTDWANIFNFTPSLSNSTKDNNILALKSVNSNEIYQVRFQIPSHQIINSNYVTLKIITEDRKRELVAKDTAYTAELIKRDAEKLTNQAETLVIEVKNNIFTLNTNLLRQKELCSKLISKSNENQDNPLIQQSAMAINTLITQAQQLIAKTNPITDYLIPQTLQATRDKLHSTLDTDRKKVKNIELENSKNKIELTDNLKLFLSNMVVITQCTMIDHNLTENNYHAKYKNQENDVEIIINNNIEQNLYKITKERFDIITSVIEAEVGNYLDDKTTYRNIKIDCYLEKSFLVIDVLCCNNTSRTLKLSDAFTDDRSTDSYLKLLRNKLELVDGYINVEITHKDNKEFTLRNYVPINHIDTLSNDSNKSLEGLDYSKLKPEDKNVAALSYLTPSKMKILLVDDINMQLKINAHFISSQISLPDKIPESIETDDYIIFFAIDGIKGIDIFKRNNDIKLIITDKNMERKDENNNTRIGMDGDKMLEEINNYLCSFDSNLIKPHVLLHSADNDTILIETAAKIKKLENLYFHGACRRTETKNKITFLLDNIKNQTCYSKPKP